MRKEIIVYKIRLIGLWTRSLTNLTKYSYRFLQILRCLILNKTGSKAKQDIITIFDQEIASGTNFITGVIIGRTRAKEEFGFYVLAFIIITSLFGVQKALISAPYRIP